MTIIDPQPGYPGGQRFASSTGEGPGPDVMAAATLEGTKVFSADGQHVGKISEIMLDVRGGRIAYAVLAEGGFLGVGATLHAIPWNALTLDTSEKCFRVAIPAQRIRENPGFEKDQWPSMTDPSWGRQLHEHYDQRPYWVATGGLPGRDAEAGNYPVDI